MAESSTFDAVLSSRATYAIKVLAPGAGTWRYGLADRGLAEESFDELVGLGLAQATTHGWTLTRAGAARRAILTKAEARDRVERRRARVATPTVTERRERWW